MKCVKSLAPKAAIIILVIGTLTPGLVLSQQPINSIVTQSIISTTVSYTNIKGAGLRNPNSGNNLISYWDSVGSSFTVNYNAPAPANILRLSQFTASGVASAMIPFPASAVVKVRRESNPDVGDSRLYYNFWAQYSSIPATGATSGTYNFTAPEVTNPEAAFLTNNLSSGYDNIFQNKIDNPHFGNIERVDFIVPAGLKCILPTDLTESGVVVIDRGTGDPFKIALITGVDANNKPTSFGNLISVTASNFGGNLLSSSFNYGILINDVKYYSESRPSTNSNQNLRGVFINLATLGVTVNQKFYGYALFGPDVTAAVPDWTTYPNNSTSSSQLDPVNVMGFFKTPGSLLPLSIGLSATRVDNAAKLQFTLYNEFTGDHLMLQASTDGVNYNDLEELSKHDAGTYTYTDLKPADGVNYYRLKMIDKAAGIAYSEIRSVKFEDLNVGISLFPNPVANQLNIHFPASVLQRNITAEVFTSSGHLVKTSIFQTAGSVESIQVNTLGKGEYMIRITNGKDKVYSVKPFAVL